MQNIRNESRQEPKILKKKSKIHGRYVGEFQPQKEIPTTLKYFLKKILRFHLQQTLWAR